jgi:hypothetical protein
MKRLSLLGLAALAVALPACGRVTALFKHADDAGAGGAAAPAASDSAAPAASAEPESPGLIGFEGEIDLKFKGKASPTPVTANLLVKNDLVRFDLPPDLLSSPEAQRFIGGGKVYTVLKATEKQVTVIMDAKRQAVVFNLDGLGDRVKAMRPPTAPPAGGGAPDMPSADPPKVTKTGKRDTVAGFSCEEWDIKNADKSRARMCVADKGASFFQLPITGIPAEHAWALELVDGKHFPVRAVAFDKDGSESGRIEVTKLDKHAVDASQFEVPAGYKTMTFDEMLQGMGGGGMPQPDVPVVPNPHKPHGGHHHPKH